MKNGMELFALLASLIACAWNSLDSFNDLIVGVDEPTSRLALAHCIPYGFATVMLAFMIWERLS